MQVTSNKQDSNYCFLEINAALLCSGLLRVDDDDDDSSLWKMGSCSHFFFFLPTLIYQLSRLQPKTCLPLRPFFFCASETGESPPDETRAASMSRACLESRQRWNEPFQPSPRSPSVLREHVYPSNVYFRRAEMIKR